MLELRRVSAATQSGRIKDINAQFEKLGVNALLCPNATFLDELLSTFLGEQPLTDGQILLDGTPGEVFAHADTLRTAGLDVPQCTAAVQYLQARGVRIRGDLNTPEQCAAALLDAWRTRGGAGRTQAGK